jgi:hypothetical protein
MESIQWSDYGVCLTSIPHAEIRSVTGWGLRNLLQSIFYERWHISSYLAHENLFCTQAVIGPATLNRRSAFSNATEENHARSRPCDIACGNGIRTPCPRSSRLCMFRFHCSYRAHCEVNRDADVSVMLGGGFDSAGIICSADRRLWRHAVIFESRFGAWLNEKRRSAPA